MLEVLSQKPSRHFRQEFEKLAIKHEGGRKRRH
jgi:hypothetical protein